MIRCSSKRYVGRSACIRWASLPKSRFLVILLEKVPFWWYYRVTSGTHQGRRGRCISKLLNARPARYCPIWMARPTRDQNVPVSGRSDIRKFRDTPPPTTLVGSTGNPKIPPKWHFFMQNGQNPRF